MKYNILKIIKISFCLLALSGLVFPHYAKAEANNTLFVELLGNGLLYSLNYERLITPNFSARAGYGYLGANGTDSYGTKVDVGITLIPITGSFLLGSGNSKFELGAGMLIVSISGEIADVSGSATGTGATGVIGYRFQPEDGGFNFRVGLTPHITPDGFMFWVGLGLGYSF